MTEAKSADKQLKNKAVKIQGKDYVLVSDRILYFNEKYKEGCIKTFIHSWEGNQIVMTAKVFPDLKTPDRFFTGFAQEVEGSGYINKTSALENCETSAVGRALAMMGIGVIDSIASVDEITKAKNREKTGVKKVAAILPVLTDAMFAEKEQSMLVMLQDLSDKGKDSKDLLEMVKMKYAVPKSIVEKILAMKIHKTPEKLQEEVDEAAKELDSTIGTQPPIL